MLPLCRKSTEMDEIQSFTIACYSSVETFQLSVTHRFHDVAHLLTLRDIDRARVAQAQAKPDG